MNPISRFQRDIYQRLLCSPALAYAQIFHARPRVENVGGTVTAITDTTIQQALNKALMGLTKRSAKAGIGIMRDMPRFVDGGSLSNVASGVLEMSITVQENPLVNMGASGTGEDCESWALAVVAELQSWGMVSTADGRKSGSVVVLDKEAIRPVAMEGSDAMVSYAVTFSRTIAFTRPQRCTAPTITAVSGGVTLATGTAGASILYTLNGEYPGTNADGDAAEKDTIAGVQTYAGGTVTVASGQTIRAVTVKTGLGQSDLVEMTL